MSGRRQPTTPEERRLKLSTMGKNGSQQQNEPKRKAVCKTKSEHNCACPFATNGENEQAEEGQRSNRNCPAPHKQLTNADMLAPGPGHGLCHDAGHNQHLQAAHTEFVRSYRDALRVGTPKRSGKSLSVRVLQNTVREVSGSRRQTETPIQQATTAPETPEIAPAGVQHLSRSSTAVNAPERAGSLIW